MGVGAGLYMCDVVKKVHVRYLISWWVLVKRGNTPPSKTHWPLDVTFAHEFICFSVNNFSELPKGTHAQRPPSISHWRDWPPQWAVYGRNSICKAGAHQWPANTTAAHILYYCFYNSSSIKQNIGSQGFELQTKTVNSQCFKFRKIVTEFAYIVKQVSRLLPW